MTGLILGVGGMLGHDGNAALLSDGCLVASSQEERYSRRKHDPAFPRAAILDCLAIAGARPADVAHCVFAEKPLQSLVFDRLGGGDSRVVSWLSRLVPESAFQYPRLARDLLPNAKFGYAWHHLSHAAAAFATSPFGDAAFLCVDGKGENVSATIGVVDSNGPRIERELGYENGIGLLYSLVTAFLGFASFGSEYKVMGLAPYGAPTLVEKLREFVRSNDVGALRLKEPVRFAWPDFEKGVGAFERHIGSARRGKGEPLEDLHIDVAASLQRLFEEEILRMAYFAREVTGRRDLLFCGGCAQNCVAAGKLRTNGPFERVFNSPVGGDMGSGFGAAILGHRSVTGRLPKLDPQGFYLGSLPGPAPHEAMRHREPAGHDLHAKVAGILAEGKIVGWVRGRMELGARALGARSILADPRVSDMQSMLNQKVKFRESFRPFAPAVLAEHCAQWFDCSEASDFMEYTAYLVPERRRPTPENLHGLRARLDFSRCDVPSIVHVDYSARLQTVRAETHPDFHRLLAEFNKQTGVPLLINTSFNVSGQPIVRTAEEAWQCFRHTDIDYLVVNDELFLNPSDRTRQEKLEWLKQFENHA